MRNIILNAPVESGQLFSLRDCGVDSFVNGAMGRGAAAKNTNGRIIAPFSGRVLKIFRNAISIVSNNEINLFIQTGDSSFYEASVRENQQINANQILAYFNVNKIVMFAVKNAEYFGDITFQLSRQNYTIKNRGGGNTRANNAKEDDVMESNFTILGESTSGKTCYLLGMYYEMSMGVASYTVTATDPDLDRTLAIRYKNLTDNTRGASRFPEPTDQPEEFNFKLQYAYETIRSFKWMDYPGTYLDKTRRDVDDERYKRVAQSIAASDILFICIDGANLIEGNTRKKINRVRNKCAHHINPYIIELRDKLKEVNLTLPPIGMLVTKYDLCADYTDADEVRDIIEEVFAGLFEGDDNQNFVAVIPVSLGKTLEYDSYQGELEPLNVHLPILMGVNFALIRQLEDDKKRIEGQRRNINDLREWKRYEDNRWGITRWLFGGRDPDAIQYDIDREENNLKNSRQVAGYFKKSLKRMNRELAEIDMIFDKGKWLNAQEISKMWAERQSIADYNF